nr:pentapeptide repeat-containing protein [Dendronalium sp. ChiSLP03b]MDZ8209117.1 pentapeptide repeat-containing protein [Dendronalium sp. ChiSLP03b]
MPVRGYNIKLQLLYLGYSHTRRLSFKVLKMPAKMDIALPELGECRYNGKFGNFCHRPGIPSQGGLCYWHSNLPKTRDKFIEEYLSGGHFEGVVIAGMDLSNLNLQDAFLRGFTAYQCSFDRTNLSHAFMQMAVFEGCNFIEANLDHVIATHAKLTNCIFYKASIKSSDLLAADLTNSDFNQANLQDAYIGQPMLIVFPGLGNAEQYRTCIEGASFKGADFQNIHLDPIYLDAPNLQEPLKQVWLHKVQLQLEAAKHAKTNKQKKETLENLTKIILEKIPGLKVQYESKRRETDEIDLIVSNQSPVLLNIGLSGAIFVECKNEAKSVGSEVVFKLASKILPGNWGLIVTTNNLSRDAEKAIRNQHLRNIKLVFWDKSDLEKISIGDNTPEERIIERYYYVLSL